MLSKSSRFGLLARNLSLNNEIKVWLSTSKSKVAKKEKSSIRGLENEPNEPIVKTEIPGPNSKKLIGDLSKIQVRKFWLNLFILI